MELFTAISSLKVLLKLLPAACLLQKNTIPGPGVCQRTNESQISTRARGLARPTTKPGSLHVPRVVWYLMLAQFVSPYTPYEISEASLPHFTIENQYETDRNCVAVDDMYYSFSTQTNSLLCIDSSTSAYFFATWKEATVFFISFNTYFFPISVFSWSFFILLFIKRNSFFSSFYMKWMVFFTRL